MKIPISLELVLVVGFVVLVCLLFLLPRGVAQ